MAFVFQSERDSSPESSRITPGPGQYMGPNTYKFDPSQAPFLSNSVRMPEKDPTFDNPEATPQVVVIKNSLKGNRVSTKPLGQAPNTARQSVNFGSKVERFNEVINDAPGPGAYSRNSRMGKRYNMPPLDSSRRQSLPRNKSVPSIPSQMHSHGYCEGENGLMLNEHPIEETQNLPGTRMHEMKDAQVLSKKVKGAPWSRISEKTVQSYIPKVTTVDTVGPGTYEISERGSVTERRMSVGFQSKVDRSCSVVPLRRSNSTARVRPSYSGGLPSLAGLSQVVGRTGDDEDSEEDDEYVKDCTPGPGYYYNASTASSFYSKAPSTISRKSDADNGNRGLIFGQKAEPMAVATERFKERFSVGGDIGPGTYDIKREIIKKEMSFKRIPFKTSDLRFEKSKVLDVPGPGAYKVEPKFGKEYKKEKVKEEGDKSLSMVEGLPGSKVKIEDVLHESKRMLKNKTPGPGDYNPKVLSEMGKKEERESYNFASRVRREALGKLNSDIPSVGAYNVNQYDIATKVIREREEEEMEQSPRRPGFNSTNPRFKDEHLEESDDDEEVNWKPKRDLASVLKAQKPPKKSVMFASKVRKMVGEEEKNIVPGPGSYHNWRQSGWNKTSFNVNFSKATYT